MLLSALSVSMVINRAGAGSGWLTGWKYRRTITIDKTGVDLTGFPVLIHLSATSGKGSTDVTSIFDEVGSNSNAIAFVDGSGARLNFEVEKWNSTGREAWVWIGTNLTGTSNTVLYMYYDSTQDGSSYNNAGKVWQNSFTGVWHLSEPGTGTRYDSTSNHNDGTPSGYTGNEKTTGTIDGADNFDGSNKYLVVGNGGTLNFDITDSFSVSAWIKRGSLSTINFIVTKQLSSGTLRGYNLWIYNNQVWWDFFHDYSASPEQRMTVATVSTISDTNWHYLVAQYNGSASATGMKIYLDGQEQNVIIPSEGGTLNNIVGTIQTTVPFCIGARYGGDHPWNGVLDEVEVSNNTRSSAWIQACYATQTDQIITWGAEHQQAENAVSQSSPADGTTQTQWTVNFSYNITYYDTPRNACLRIFNLKDNSLVSTVWNTTALQNGTSVNYGSYTFTSEQGYKWDCEYYNNSGNSWTTDGNWTLTVDVPPRYQNVGENATLIVENGTIELYAQGNDGIGLNYAWLSTNESGTWTNYTVSIPRETDWDNSKYSQNPVLSPGTGGGWTNFGSIVKENSTCWWMYYTSAPAAGSPMSICRAESTDGGYTWVKDDVNNPILTANASNSWENQNLLCPCVWKEGATWKMIYTATGPYPQAGYAYSTDGVHWQRYSGNPVLTPSGGWESGGNEVWGVMKVGSTYYAWYSPWAGGAPPTPLRQIGLATSTDLINWNKDPNNPIFSASSPDYGRYCACPFKFKDYYYMLMPYGWQNATYKFELFRDSNPTFYPEDRTSLGWVMSLGKIGKWDSYFMDTPYVATNNITKVLDEGNMLVYYSGTGNSAMTPYGTGLVVLDAEQALTGVLGAYGSPQDMNAVANSWCWSNFTWTNNSIKAGTTVQWRIYYNDTYGNVAVTSTQSFMVTAPKLSVEPSVVQKTSSDMGTRFTEGIDITGAADLFGFDINVTWDNSLINYYSNDTSPLNSVWPGGWTLVKNETGVNGETGWWKIIAASTSSSFSSPGTQPLFSLTFTVQDPQTNSMAQTLLHFDTQKLNDSGSMPIAHATEDGTYSIWGQQPTLDMLNSTGSDTRTCRMCNETFTVAVEAYNAASVTGFEYEIHFNASQLNVESVAYNAWPGSGTSNIDNVNGILTGSTSGTVTSGTLSLITITFNATLLHMWKAISGWQNLQTSVIYIQAANMSYLTPQPELQYVKNGAGNQISVNPPFTYTFSPIKGDLNNDGAVNIGDLSILATKYDTSDADYNLVGSDNLVDVFDLVIVASNFWFFYTP